MDNIQFTEQVGVQGNLGIINLNRPQVLNAITHTMTKQLAQQLTIWARQDHIKAVIIRGQGTRAFCAGGDIRSLYDEELTRSEFFADEYRLNAAIADYPKPFIAWCNGVTMGGGVGLSIYASHRIATEHYTFAMPETGIGFFPDVGASYFLNRCPGQTGIYLGLTGARLNAQQAANLGLIDSIIPAHAETQVLQVLCQTPLQTPLKPFIKQLLNPFTVPIQSTELNLSRRHIDHCFAKTSITRILTALAQQQDPQCDAVIQQLQTKSPTSLKVSLALLQGNKGLNLKECLQIEYRLAQHFLQNHDFFEGVRAIIIDKDQQPHWQPTRLSAISKKDIAAYFAVLSKDRDLFL